MLDFFFIIIIMGVWASLYTSQLILQILNLTTM